MTNIIEQLQPGWNEIARQRSDQMSWQQTGKISIGAARQLYDAGIVDMATKRERVQVFGKSIPGAEMVLRVKLRGKPEDRVPYFSRKEG